MMRIAIVVLLLACSFTVHSQAFPDTIRGYKVHEQKIDLHVGDPGERRRGDDIVLAVSGPKVENIGLSGLELSVGASVKGVDHSGRIETITFKDVKVNGTDAAVADFNEPFTIRAGSDIVLPRSLRVTVGLGGLAQASYQELTDRKGKWRVTGTAFIFGRFKKFGFSFKRVVPVPFDVEIDNPVPDLKATGFKGDTLK